MSKGNTPRPNKEGHAAEFAARRRIIKGLASVPAVATLSNASAQAVASNLQCIGKEPGPVPAPNQPPPPDTPVYDCKDTSVTQEYLNSGVYFDPGESVPAARKTKSGGAGDGQDCVVFVDSNGTSETFDSTAGLNPVTPSCYTSFV